MGNKLFCAVMYHAYGDFLKAIFHLEKEFGDISKQSEEYEFNFTDYYEKEFGIDLKKVMVIFDKAIIKEDLIPIRLRTGEIEKELSKDDKRTVNIDPGYVSETEVVLATMKFQSFKEELGDGVYLHKVLEFKDNEVITFEHTFADYKDHLEFFHP